MLKDFVVLAVPNHGMCRRVLAALGYSEYPLRVLSEHAQRSWRTGAGVVVAIKAQLADDRVPVREVGTLVSMQGVQLLSGGTHRVLTGALTGYSGNSQEYYQE